MEGEHARVTTTLEIAPPPVAGDDLSTCDFLHALWETRRGYVCLARDYDNAWSAGRYQHADWREEFFRWPDQEDAILAYAEAAPPGNWTTVDRYVAPMQFSGRKRRK